MLSQIFLKYNCIIIFMEFNHNKTNIFVFLFFPTLKQL